MPSKRSGAAAYATESSLRAVEADVKRLSSQVAQLDTKVEQLDTKVERLDTRLETHVKQLDTNMKQIDAKLEWKMTDLEARLFDEIHFVGALVERLDAKMTTLSEGLRGEVTWLKERWAEGERRLEVRVLDLEDVVRRGSRSGRALDDVVKSIRADLASLRAEMNEVRDDLVKWQCDGGELPPIIAEHNARFDDLERRLVAIERRLRA
jgi:chromosome segregation ATPase